MTTTWILVADATKAFIYSAPKARLLSKNVDGSALTLVDQFSHEKSRKKDGDLLTDKFGSYQTMGSAHGTYAEPTDPKFIEIDRFARELAIALDDGRKHNHYNDLILVAAPAFLGMLNEHLNPHVANLVSTKVEKEYTACNQHQLLEHLHDYL